MQMRLTNRAKSRFDSGRVSAATGVGILSNRRLREITSCNSLTETSCVCRQWTLHLRPVQYDAKGESPSCGDFDQARTSSRLRQRKGPLPRLSK